MDQLSKEKRVIMTCKDLEDIRSLAAQLYSDLNPVKLKMNDSQFRAYCYVQATQAWLRERDLLQVILD